MAQLKYFRAFNAVEIDSSFYQLPKLATVTRWRAAAPAGFQFAMKAWQVITHRGTSPTYKHTRLDPTDREKCGDFGFNPTVRWAWDETFAVAKELGVCLVLFQCPSSFRPLRDNINALKSFFERAKRGKFQMGWEPRGEWEPELIAALCKELDLVHVVDPFKSPPALKGKIQYYRLHGVTGARHQFTPDELQRLAALCTGRQTTYCFFNNVSMSADAARFAKLLAAR